MKQFQTETIVLDKKGNFSSISKMNLFDTYNDYQIKIIYEQFTYKKHITLELNKYGYIYTLKHSLYDDMFYISNDTDIKHIYYDDVLSYVDNNYHKIMNFYKKLIIYKNGI